MCGPKLLTVEGIREALAGLAGELAADGQQGELVIVGGAAIALTLGGREATRDVDAYISQPEASAMRAAAQRVAINLDLPLDWLNDGAKGYMLGLDLGPVVFEAENLIVYAASNLQLLAMKLWAWRDDQDFDDAARLLGAILALSPNLTREEIWTKVEDFLPPAERLKPSYALEDLWQSKSSSSQS
jgi:hypothetical protein